MNETSAASNPSLTTLKRTRPTEHTNRLPPLPKLTTELILQVFTHTSLRRSTGNPEDYGDNERLVGLGKAVLDATVTFALFNEKPILKTLEICERRDQALCDANFEAWVKLYGLQQKLRCHPDVFSTLDTPKEMRIMFYSYVGGIYAELGIETVQEWINKLIQVDPTAPPQLSEPVPQRIETPPPQKKMKSEQWSPQHQPIFFASQPPASPIRQVPPHLSTYPASHSQPPSYQPARLQFPKIPPPTIRSQPSNPLAPAQPTSPFLPLFNQTATQRRVTVEYPAEFSGPSHAGRWTVRCVVNGISKGVGSGSSKQIAKEEAARQAYYAMGWT